MGRYIICDIATKIKVETRLNLQENREEMLKRIASTFDLYLEKDNVKNKYYLKGVDEYSEDESPLNCENYSNCTNMSDETLFNDNIERGELKINFNYLLLYFQADTTYSEDICFTLNF